MFLSKNRIALVNPVPELGPKQPRVIAENRNNHRVTQRWLLLLSSRKENRQRLSSSVKIILWRMLIWVFQQRAVQETGLRKAGHSAEVVWFSARAWARVRQTGYKSQPASPSTTVCLCASYLNSLGLGFSSVKSLQDHADHRHSENLYMVTQSLTHKWCSIHITSPPVLSSQLSVCYLGLQVPSETVRWARATC